MKKPLGLTLCLMLAAATVVGVAAGVADLADLKVGTTTALADLKVGITTGSADLKVGTTTDHIRSAGLQARQTAQAAQSAAPAQASASAVLSKYCVTCHNEKRKTAGLMIDKLDLQQVGVDAEVWEKVARKFRTHEMPPPGVARPDA